MQEHNDDRQKRDDETVPEWADRVIRADGYEPVHPWAVDPDRVTEDARLIEFHASQRTVREFEIQSIGYDDRTDMRVAKTGADGYISVPYGDDADVRADVDEDAAGRWPGRDVKVWRFDADTLED